MSDVTDADREKAAEIARAVGAIYDTEPIAQAIADERANARAPFLAFLDKLEKSVKWEVGGTPKDMFSAERAGIAMNLRRAAEEQQ